MKNPNTTPARPPPLDNLRPFDTLPPEEHRELSRRGGIASGERRRYLADLRLAMIEALAGIDLAQETREEYRRAIKRYVKDEARRSRERTKRKSDHKKAEKKG